MKKIKNLLVLMAASLALVLNLAPNLAYAQNPAKGAIQCGVNAGAGQGGTGTNCPTDPNATGRLNTTISRSINILSVVVGIVAVIMLIYGGFRYITSAGDTARVAAAKTTVFYAIVGLIIVALAQVIVRFVLTSVS